MNKVIIERKIYKIAAEIAKKFKPNKVILFGSYAWGSPHADSDVDLFIIKETPNTREAAREIDGEIFPRPFAIDLIVYTPSQVKERQLNGDAFINEILSKGKLLYAEK